MTPIALSDDEAIKLCAEKPGSFPQSLVGQHRTNGGRLSLKQWQWVHKLANEVLEARKLAGAAKQADLLALFDTLEKAEVRLARFLVGKNEVKLRRNRQGTSYYALQGDAHLGSVTKDGQFRRGAGLSLDTITAPALIASLEAFAADPIGVMVKYGLETGTCGVCGRALTDADSVKAGIGPVCLKKLGG